MLRQYAARQTTRCIEIAIEAFGAQLKSCSAHTVVARTHAHDCPTMRCPTPARRPPRRAAASAAPAPATTATDPSPDAGPSFPPAHLPFIHRRPSSRPCTPHPRPHSRSLILASSPSSSRAVCRARPSGESQGCTEGRRRGRRSGRRRADLLAASTVLELVHVQIGVVDPQGVKLAHVVPSHLASFSSRSKHAGFLAIKQYEKTKQKISA